MRFPLFLMLLLGCGQSIAQQPFFFEDARENYQKVERQGQLLAVFKGEAQYLRIDEEHFLYVDPYKTGVYQLQENSLQTAYLESDGIGYDTRMIQKNFLPLCPVGAWHFPSEGEGMYPRSSAPSEADSLLIAKDADELIYYRDKILKIVNDERVYIRLDDSTYFAYQIGVFEGNYRISSQLDEEYIDNPFFDPELMSVYYESYPVGPWIEQKELGAQKLRELGIYVAGERRGFWRHFDIENTEIDSLWLHEAGKSPQYIAPKDKIFERDTLEMSITGRWWLWEVEGNLQALRAEEPPRFAQYEWEVGDNNQSRIRRIGKEQWERLKWNVRQKSSGLLELRLQQNYLGSAYQNFWLQKDRMWWFSDQPDFLGLIIAH